MTVSFSPPTGDVTPAKRQHVEQGLESIREALLTLRYGSVAVTVHEDRIVQIDVTERTRLRPGK